MEISSDKHPFSIILAFLELTAVNRDTNSHTLRHVKTADFGQGAQGQGEIRESGVIVYSPK